MYSEIQFEYEMHINFIDGNGNRKQNNVGNTRDILIDNSNPEMTKYSKRRWNGKLTQCSNCDFVNPNRNKLGIVSSV